MHKSWKQYELRSPSRKTLEQMLFVKDHREVMRFSQQQTSSHMYHTGTEETSWVFEWSRFSFSGLGRRRKLCFHGKSTEFGYTLSNIFKHNLKSMIIQRNKQSCSAYSRIWATIWCTYLIELGALTWNRGLWQHPSAIWGKKRWTVSQINWHPKIVIWTPLLNCLKLWSWRIQTWLRHD